MRKLTPTECSSAGGILAGLFSDDLANRTTVVDRLCELHCEGVPPLEEFHRMFWGLLELRYRINRMLRYEGISELDATQIQNAALGYIEYAGISPEVYATIANGVAVYSPSGIEVDSRTAFLLDDPEFDDLRLDKVRDGGQRSVLWFLLAVVQGVDEVDLFDWIREYTIHEIDAVLRSHGSHATVPMDEMFWEKASSYTRIAHDDAVRNIIDRAIRAGGQ